MDEPNKKLDKYPLPKRSLKKTKNILLELLPDITAVFDDFDTMRKKFGKKDDPNTAENEAGVINDFLSMILIKHYDNILKVLSLMYGMKSDEIENLEDDNDVFDMVFTLLSDASFMRFLPRVRLLGRTMR